MGTITMRAVERLKFGYHSLRTISSPDDVVNGRRIYCGHAPAKSFLNLPDSENVRTYLVDAEGKKRKRLTDVHRQIRETLTQRPEDFPVLNSGIVIVARSAEVNDKENFINLAGPSIINGSQTRGEIQHYLDHCISAGIDPHDVHVKFEIIVTDDDNLIAEISIARNFQNDVARLSIAGRRQQLEDIEQALQSTHPHLKLRKSETDRSDDFYDTEKLIQVLTALIPKEIWPVEKEKNDPRKAFTYSAKSKCLKQFQDIHESAKIEGKAHEGAVKLYQFFVDMTPTAHDLYELWSSHSGFYGTKLRAIERDARGKIVRVPDGIIFPAIAALSAFVQFESGHWIYRPTDRFTDEDLIQAVASQYMEVADSNPGTMGKTHGIYASLYQLTSLVKRLEDR